MKWVLTNSQMFLMRVCVRARFCVCVCVCVCVVHWHCSAQLSMFNMEKHYRNKIIIIIIINNVTECWYNIFQKIQKSIKI